ncbi:MAG: hypothetical protein ACK5QH_05090 [Rubrivivax sp.]|jgi:hypothetical protein
MRPLWTTLLCLPALLTVAPAARAQVTLELGLSRPGVHIGLVLARQPTLQRIPGYPVYYAPEAEGNYFYYDGVYWVLQDEDWYASTWYNGPWHAVGRLDVPLFLLRVPVRYYRRPPVFFRTWRADEAPRWGEHWGPGWLQGRERWNTWDRRRTPPPAPLPHYQRPYTDGRYPADPSEQQRIRAAEDRRSPADPVVRQHFQDPTRVPIPQAVVPLRPAPPAAPAAPAPARDHKPDDGRPDHPSRGPPDGKPDRTPDRRPDRQP